MRSDRLTPQDWLTQQPLRKDEHLYVVVSAASDADALKTLHMAEPDAGFIPIWGGTPYDTWQPVMPYLSELKPRSAFLTWVAETDAEDWGWLAVSTCAPQVVFEHLRSLTQVKTPDGAEVFFRFWDGRHIYPILEGLGDSASGLIPVFERYLINGRTLETGSAALPAVKDWPWWEVPQPLLDQLTTKDPVALIDNLMQWLSEERPDIYVAFPESILRHKIDHFVRRTDISTSLNEALLNHLILEQG
ncbi:DUF4123 domain-containing protein [Pseudomonas sp. SZ57]|uniref:DUF4123 domain-containing protein n=1 Tax=Pseudomonas TaxID=286 RepID=UPI00061AEE36|nr:DUF4123 domain-containing protein [Pseudomonas syringae]MQQ36399.1 DUF4123 domain-containing protein [Pseudomonas sp. SZ57]